MTVTLIYSANKFALEAVSESCAQEVLPYDIRVRLTEPGFTQTPILDVVLASPARETVYLNDVQRTQILFSQGKQTGDSPQRTAEAIEAAISSTKPKLLSPIEGGASILIDGRSKMSDKEWILMGRQESAEDYFQEFAMRFPISAQRYKNFFPLEIPK